MSRSPWGEESRIPDIERAGDPAAIAEVVQDPELAQEISDEMAHAASGSSPTFTGLADEEGGEPFPDVGLIEAERDDYLEALRRLQADFENYKKRVHKQQAEQVERAAEGLVTKLLGVLDTLDLALAHVGGTAPATQETAGPLDVEVAALAQVSTMLNEVLGREGLERIDPLGQGFDPTESDAVLHEQGEGPPLVSEVLRAGYRWKGRVLRPAMVKVTG